MQNSKRSGSGSRGTGSIGVTAAASGQNLKPYFTDNSIALYCGDCREIVPLLSEKASLLIADPPYSRVVNEEWDRLSKSQLCRLLDDVFETIRPKLTDNAAIYAFAWPHFAGMLEHIMSKYFNVLNHIVWNKQDLNGRKNGYAAKADITVLRNYFCETERVIFAEQNGADGQYRKAAHLAKNEVFRPLIEYFRNARAESGLTAGEICEKMFQLTGKRYAFERHAFSYSQWEFPTKEQFMAAATFLPLGDHGQAFENYQAAKDKYDELRQQWSQLRRMHQASKRNYTDLWQYRPLMPGVTARVHPCQKPREMLRDMIETSSRNGDLVLDCFAGSGETAFAARETSRRCILIEKDPDICYDIAARLKQ